MSFTDLFQHWNHYLERDIPPDAPAVQVQAMRHAFVSGAISGAHLMMLTISTTPPGKRREAVKKLTEAIMEFAK